MNRHAEKQKKYKSPSKSKSPPKRSENQEANISADARHENLQVQINNYNFKASKKAQID